MSEQWFQVWPSFNDISPVQVDRYTETSVWINGRRYKRIGWRSYFSTWTNAHRFLMEHAQAEVVDAKLALQKANSRLGNVQGMRQPTQGVP